MFLIYHLASSCEDKKTGRIVINVTEKQSKSLIAPHVRAAMLMERTMAKRSFATSLLFKT